MYMQRIHDYEFRVPASLAVGQQKEGWTKSRCLDPDFYV